MIEVVGVNGALSLAHEARISPLDRGFLYGDSVYETVRTYGGRPFLLDRHLDRLRRSAEAIGLDAARVPVDPGRAVREALDRAGAGPGVDGEAAIRIILSRGTGGIGYDDSDCGPPTLVVHVRPCPLIPESWRREGVDVAIVDVRRNAAEALDPAIKSSNLLNNLLAWRAARRLGAYEPILLDAAGAIAEGASSNVFLVQEGRLLTPALSVGILRGITRDAVIDRARSDGIPVEESVLEAGRLARADEAFLTSTLKGVLPIRRVDGWPIREGRPGPLTRRIAALYDALTQDETKAGSAPEARRR
jgi:branched-chain amino acid aminotransferase